MTYTVLSALLAYPDAEMVAALPELRSALAPADAATLAPLFAMMEGKPDLIALQEEYVATFDRRPAHSLHLFEHVHGESRDRGQAMVNLREEYLRHGLEPRPGELPDYVPMFLEFLGQLPAPRAAVLLGDAIHVLARIGDKLDAAGSPYARAFDVLRRLTDVQPQALPEPPEGDMEEGMVTFGPGAGMAEPVLRAHGQPQPVRFHATDPRRAATGPGKGGNHG
ncbi:MULTISPECIES: nitrate reductase molybdenum cofactor assembly chaperone [unclassified Pigmentiphaga]|uniref:nitrate reductase molybdenum cofactor assembly chaperone n=1 Tax=unclassified Pigmentiphaga TaxID=2626614 RepID=UPI000B40E5A4|nr:MULTISPECIES: nitrate reductase molybdenum cofactor assembly chaperone [unclassified Pigmentiphaga]OVZ62094.1 nitrate reductase molybdenum cofactor assembly chaperone [Pigmentiphaga sp. NML030171]